MAADEQLEEKEALLSAIDRRVHSLMREMGLATPIGIPGQSSNIFEVADPGNYTAEAFTIGYDTGTETNVIPFTLDVSILYGTGTDGDILTG